MASAGRAHGEPQQRCVLYAPPVPGSIREKRRCANWVTKGKSRWYDLDKTMRCCDPCRRALLHDKRKAQAAARARERLAAVDPTQAAAAGVAHTRRSSSRSPSTVFGGRSQSSRTSTDLLPTSRLPTSRRRVLTT
jgi:hypothetical protein